MYIKSIILGKLFKIIWSYIRNMNNSDLIQIMLDLTKDKYGKSSLKEIRPFDRILSNSYPHGNPIHFHHPITNDPYTFSIDLDDDDSHLNAIRKANEVFNKIRVDLGKQGKYSEFRMDFPEWGFEVYLYYDEIEIDIDIARRIKIIDNEELFKLNDDDDDFIPRFNRTMYEYLILKKESVQAEGRWDEKNIWYTPYRNFGDWFDKHPEYVDAKPYFNPVSGKINWKEPLWKLALKMRKRKDRSDFNTYMNAYRYAVRQYDSYGEPIKSPEKLVIAFENARGQLPKEIVDYLDD